jgi:hypothetical protein
MCIDNPCGAYNCTVVVLKQHHLPLSGDGVGTQG